MRSTTLFKIGIFLTIPSLALSSASLVIVGGLYRDSLAAYKAEQARADRLIDVMASTSRQMRQAQAELNGALDNRISAALSLMAVRLDAVERASMRTTAKPEAKVRNVSALPDR